MDLKTFDSLPYDILLEIFKYLSFEELISCAQYVNKSWQSVIQDPMFWKDVWYKPSVGMKTDDVITLLQKAPLLRSFEFHEGIKPIETFDALCNYNKNITSIALDTYEASRNAIERLLATFPNLEYLQIPISVFIKNINILGEFQKLKKVKCTRISQYHPVETLRRVPQPLKESDWNALEELELYSEYWDGAFERMFLHVKEKLLRLEVQAILLSKTLDHIQYCVNLQELKINFGSRSLQASELEKFFSSLRKLTKLRYLSLTSFIHADQNILCTIFRQTQFSRLTKLELFHCMNFSPRVAHSIVAACPQLRVFCLNGCLSMDDACLREFGRCTRLQILNLSGCSTVTETGFSHLTRCHHLRELNINWIGLVSSPMLEQIAKLKSLHCLHLDHTEVNSKHLLGCIKQLLALQYLSVYRTSGVNGEEIKKALPGCFVRYRKPEFTTMLKENASNLQVLRVNGASKDVLLSLPLCDNLQECSIDFLLRPCITFSDVFTSLKKCKNLHTLILKRFVATEDGLLCRLLDGVDMSQLRVLELEHCLSVDDDVAMLIARNYPQLEKLKLQSCVALSDLGLAAIVKMQCICVLDISGCCGLTESGLLSLSYCKQLKDLNVWGLLPEVVSDKVLNCVVALPELSTMHVNFSDNTDKYMKNKNWILKEKCLGGTVATYEQVVCS